MGTDLYYTIPPFFEERMAEHSMVQSCQRLPVADEYLYQIGRRRFGDVVTIWLADQYHFTDIDYYNRPSQLQAGDYILVAKPEGTADVRRQLVEGAKIGVGKLGELMGALNKREMWKYVPPTDDEKSERQRRSGRIG